MKNFDIEIHPIKWLYYNLPEEERTACAIVISSYEVRLNKLDKLKSKLILSFADIDDCRNESAFRKEHAEKIRRYVDTLPSDTEVLFVCCDSGESRSSAVACSILRYFGEDDMKIWKTPSYHPNPLVYKLLCDEFGVKVSDDEVRERVAINKNALSDTIRNARKGIL